MNGQLAFTIVVLFILMVIIAHVFACERNDTAGSGVTGGNDYNYRLLPAGKGPHEHLAALNEKGYGTSTTDSGHGHPVKHFKVEPGTDGHIHDITQYIVPTSFT